MKVLYALRGAAGLHAVVICLQPVFAGVYLNGTPLGIRMHANTADVVVAVALVQLLAATFWWRTGGRWVAPAVSLLIVAGEVMQTAMGYSRQLAIHVPLGVALVVSTVAFAFWINRRPA